MAGAQRESRWVEISVEVEREAVDDVAALLGRYCTGGAVVEDVGGMRRCEYRCIPRHAGRRTVVKGFLPVWDEETRQKLEIALLLLSRSAPISEPRLTVLEPENWAESWKAFFPPQHIGRRTVIVPTWHAYDPAPGEVIIRLDPGMAFGTGLHATTRLCLAAIERHLQPGARVLDVGTGSGILAIAAALQGASLVDAIDIDPVAIRVAADNAALNGVEDRIRVSLGTVGGGGHHDVPRHTEAGYDLVLANILAEVIVELAAGLAAATRPGGLLVVSGILAAKEEAVVAALTGVAECGDASVASFRGMECGDASVASFRGIRPLEREQEDDWVAIVGRQGG